MAVFTAVVLALTVGAPVGAVEKPELPVSWMWSWMSQRPLWAFGEPSTPDQEHGSGVGGEAAYDDTKADGGAGRPAVAVKDALDSYEPFDASKAARTTGAIVEGFDPATSERDEDRSTAETDVFTNADGTLTAKAYSGPVNYREADGDWQPIDVALTKRADGRLHAEANALDTSVAAKVDAPKVDVSAGSPVPNAVGSRAAGCR